MIDFVLGCCKTNALDVPGLATLFDATDESSCLESIFGENDTVLRQRLMDKKALEKKDSEEDGVGLEIEFTDIGAREKLGLDGDTVEIRSPE